MTCACHRRRSSAAPNAPIRAGRPWVRSSAAFWNPDRCADEKLGAACAAKRVLTGVQALRSSKRSVSGRCAHTSMSISSPRKCPNPSDMKPRAPLRCREGQSRGLRAALRPSLPPRRRARAEGSTRRSELAAPAPRSASRTPSTGPLDAASGFPPTRCRIWFSVLILVDWAERLATTRNPDGFHVPVAALGRPQLALALRRPVRGRRDTGHERHVGWSSGPQR
jgi:hypothetical protein